MNKKKKKITFAWPPKYLQLACEILLGKEIAQIYTSADQYDDNSVVY